MKQIFVELSGGNIVAAYSDVTDLQLIVVDWDNISEGDMPGRLPISSVSSAEPEIMNLIESGYNQV